MRINHELYKPLIGKTVKYLDPEQKFERYGVIKSICRMKLPPLRRGNRVIKYPSMVGFKVKHPVLGMIKAPVAAILAVRWRGNDIPLLEFLNTRGKRQSVGTPKTPLNVEAEPKKVAKESTTSTDSSYPTASEPAKKTEE